MKIKVTKPFKYADQGIHVIHYDLGIHKVSKRCTEIAIEQGWAKKVIFSRKAKVSK